VQLICVRLRHTTRAILGSVVCSEETKEIWDREGLCAFVNSIIGLDLIALQCEQSLFELFAICVDDATLVENVIHRLNRALVLDTGCGRSCIDSAQRSGSGRPPRGGEDSLVSIQRCPRAKH
jgi:hypothetical protein